MKKIIITSLSLLTMLSFLISACQQAPQPTAAPTEMDHSHMSQGAAIKVLAVETFLAEIAQNVAGERVKIESLVPLGVDPHAFEPTPQDVVKIAESQVLILNGAGFEEWATRTLENAGGTRTVIEASAGLTSREAREGEEAVMSPEEKAEALCVDLAEKTAVEALNCTVKKNTTTKPNCSRSSSMPAMAATPGMSSLTWLRMVSMSSPPMAGRWLWLM
jgi:ABC-type Zn uptake system ZnuABC Zn-binding protein ZnuA